MTIYPIKHVDYSRGDRVDHLFVVVEAGPTPSDLADTALLVSVTDTGLDVVLDGQPEGWRDRKGFSLTWAEVIARVLSGEFHHQQCSTDDNVPPADTTESDSTADDEFVSRCGYCGDVIDYCQGHGEDERAQYGFDYDSDEYEERREAFESADQSNGHKVDGVDILQWKHDGDPVVVVLTEEEAGQLQDLIDTSSGLNEDYPALSNLYITMGA